MLIISYQKKINNASYFVLGIDCDEARSEEERIMLEDAMQMLNSNKFQDRTHPRTGATALHVAAAKGYIKVMK